MLGDRFSELNLGGVEGLGVNKIHCIHVWSP